jgi:hypothetical protein
MARAKPVPFGTDVGYVDWSVRRTIREAENIARWSPWTAHEWMEQAYNRLDIRDAPFHEDYNSAVHRINAYWRSITKTRFYSQKEFWAKGKFPMPPKMLEPLYDE